MVRKRSWRSASSSPFISSTRTCGLAISRWISPSSPGRLTEEELKEKHPEEYERLLASGELDKYRTAPPPIWLKNFGRVVGGAAVVAGLVMLVSDDRCVRALKKGG